MKFNLNSRQFHKALAPWVFLPLFCSAISGLLYRVSKDLLGYSRDEVHWLMSLHEGEWLGDNGELIYVFLNSLAVLWMLITGFQMFSKNFSFFKKVTKGESKG
ncbi:PepSY domain-containing protein [Prochlorococcus sp. AH-736-K09]|nr:PepSY domain-containing protein [Prochlorococcus sp. AH-736-K09]